MRHMLRGLIGALVSSRRRHCPPARTPTSSSPSTGSSRARPRPIFVAIDKGYNKAEGLNVTVDTGPGSVAGIARVAAGTYPLGFFDINSLVKFNDQNPDKALKAVLMVYDKPPFSIVTLVKTGISKPKDLKARCWVPGTHGAYAQWKAFVKENAIDADKVKIENVGFPVREPMLADGKVDAITGFSFSSYFNLLQKGLKRRTSRCC